MAKTRLPAFRLSTLMLYIAVLMGSPAVFASQDVISDDGREVILKEDGTWEFRSTDRFANTKDGRRVRLKNDGSWEYMGNAPLTAKRHVRTTSTDIRLQRVVIESHEEKVNKNIRKKTQTVFYLRVNVSPLAEEGMVITGADLSRIRVQDNKGKLYPVLSLTPSPIDLAPNSEQTFEIRADGSPSWLRGVKSMQIELEPDIFGNKDPIKLSQDVRDMKKKKVDGFE
jgi:hypothetical protein